MQVTVRIQDRAVKAFLAKAGNVAAPLMDALCRTYVPRALTKVMVEAAKDTPIGEGALKRAGSVSTIRTGKLRAKARIGFGGMAAKYAEVQHDNADLTHTQSDFEAKYGADMMLIGFGRRAFLVSKTAGLKKMGKPEGKGKPTWTSHNEAGNLTGHKGGRSHWLYGTSTSAWERRESWVVEQIQRGVNAEVRRLLASG